jgi:hypothetical protein
MSIWQRWFGETEPEPLQHLLGQRRMIEQRGCFSDQELDAKYSELAVIDRRIEAVKQTQSTYTLPY